MMDDLIKRKAYNRNASENGKLMSRKEVGKDIPMRVFAVEDTIKIRRKMRSIYHINSKF